MSRKFSLYSVEVEISGSASSDIARDFDFFSSANSGKPRFEVRLHCESRAPSALDLPARAAERVFSDCVLYRDENRYVYEYPGAILSVARDSGASAGILITQDESLQRELAFLYLQSEIGRFLDAQGLHRVHALGIGLPSGKAALVLLPSGGGKSTMALELARQKNCVLLSDDSPLVDRMGNVHPFPMRLGFRPHAALPKEWQDKGEIFERRKHGPKILVPISALPKTVIPAQNAVFCPGFLVIGKRHGRREKPELEQISKRKGALPLFRDLVVGLGIAQVAELVLADGWKSMPGLAPVAISRARAATSFAARSSSYCLHMSREPRKDAELLIQTLAGL